MLLRFENGALDDSCSRYTDVPWFRKDESVEEMGRMVLVTAEHLGLVEEGKTEARIIDVDSAPRYGAQSPTTQTGGDVMLTDKKIKLIQELQSQTNALQKSVQMGEVIDNSKVAAAYSAMLLGGVNEEDIAAFSRQFPETPIGMSGL